MLFLGPPGAGKTHLAVSPDREAIRQNHNVQFATAAMLVAMLAKAHSDGTLDKQLTLLSRPKHQGEICRGHMIATALILVAIILLGVVAALAASSYWDWDDS